jgi:glycosyltransferase involved in cell wall biosynthesis
MTVDLICLNRDNAPTTETLGGVNILRLPIKRRRDSKVVYVWNYFAFILITAAILAWRSIKRRYDLVYINNMPDILVFASFVPKTLGAKVVLDLHDPMPELLTTIFNLDGDSLGVRLIRWLEKSSIEFSHFVLTTNSAFKRVFASRSCSPEKIGIVMNSPDEQIFPCRKPRSYNFEKAVPEKRFVIMYHGSMVERNGVDLAVAALAQVVKAVPAAELRIFGLETPFLAKVLDWARKQGLEDSVHFLGLRNLEDLVTEIADCDVGVIPNHRNSFTDINMPTRIFEYLTMGKPAISPRTTGIRDYFPEDSMIFFEPGDAQDLARKLEHVAFHYSEALDKAERGQSIYLAHTWSRERRMLTNSVDKLLNGKQLPLISTSHFHRESDSYVTSQPPGE